MQQPREIKALYIRCIHEIYVKYMPKAMIQISEDANRIINIVKAKYSLKDKSEAIDKLAEEYGKTLLEPELRPEYLSKLKRIEAEGAISKAEFEKRLKVKI